MSSLLVSDCTVWDMIRPTEGINVRKMVFRCWLSHNWYIPQLLLCLSVRLLRQCPLQLCSGSI